MRNEKRRVTQVKEEILDGESQTGRRWKEVSGKERRKGGREEVHK